MIRVAAVDDEAHALERFERMVQPIEGLELCGLFESAEPLLSYLKDHPLDAVFLDIEMPGVDGLQLCEEIQSLAPEIDIIFVTAFNQYAVDAFELQAMDYILKPLTEKRLEKTIQRLKKTKREPKPTTKPFIQCFGDFEVFVNGEALVWKNSKAKELLAFLVHKSGVAVNWEKITDAVWPEFNREKAQTNFHATAYLLRKKLAEAGLSEILEGGRGSYRVVTDKLECDAWQLEALMKGNRLKRRDDMTRLNQLLQRGYMEASGYAWAQPKAAELEEACRKAKG